VTTRKIKEAALPNYKIFETNTFLDSLNRFQKNIQNKIYNKMLNYIYPQLKKNPFYGTNIKKLANYEPDTYRYRIGKYRLFYEVDKKEKVVSITFIEIRDKAY